MKMRKSLNEKRFLMYVLEILTTSVKAVDRGRKEIVGKFFSVIYKKKYEKFTSNIHSHKRIILSVVSRPSFEIFQSPYASDLH